MALEELLSHHKGKRCAVFVMELKATKLTYMLILSTNSIFLIYHKVSKEIKTYNFNFLVQRTELRHMCLLKPCKRKYQERKEMIHTILIFYKLFK